MVGPNPTENAERSDREETQRLRNCSSVIESAIYEIATGLKPPENPDINRNAIKIQIFRTLDRIKYARPTTINENKRARRLP